VTRGSRDLDSLWQVYSRSTEGAGDSIPRFFFLGTIIFDRQVFRSQYLALDTILFANSHAAILRSPITPACQS
jgi:hypothetical protein